MKRKGAVKDSCSPLPVSWELPSIPTMLMATNVLANVPSIPRMLIMTGNDPLTSIL